MEKHEKLSDNQLDWIESRCHMFFDMIRKYNKFPLQDSDWHEIAEYIKTVSRASRNNPFIVTMGLEAIDYFSECDKKARKQNMSVVQPEQEENRIRKQTKKAR